MESTGSKVSQSLSLAVFFLNWKTHIKEIILVAPVTAAYCRVVSHALSACTPMWL